MVWGVGSILRLKSPHTPLYLHLRADTLIFCLLRFVSKSVDNNQDCGMVFGKYEFNNGLRLMKWGKHHASMYEGSMIGAGAIPFAIMGYVIAKQLPDREVGWKVFLNPKLLSAIIGETEEDLAKGIAYLCGPDGASTSKEEEGRRLVKVAEYAYKVVNGAKYQAIKNEEVRKEQNREAQARHRERQGKASKQWKKKDPNAIHGDGTVLPGYMNPDEPPKDNPQTEEGIP